MVAQEHEAGWVRHGSRIARTVVAVHCGPCPSDSSRAKGAGVDQTCGASDPMISRLRGAGRSTDRDRGYGWFCVSQSRGETPPRCESL